MELATVQAIDKFFQRVDAGDMSQKCIAPTID